jgi:hypothetical protein
MKAALAAVVALALSACATGKSEVPECVRLYTGAECDCHTGGFGATTVVHGVNKTVAGATVGAVTSSVHAVGSYCDPVQGVLYAPVALVAGAFTGFVDGVGHVPAVQNCHYSFPASLGYAWWRDYRIGTADAQVAGHRAAQWNGGAMWPGGPR